MKTRSSNCRLYSRKLPPLRNNDNRGIVRTRAIQRVDKYQQRKANILSTQAINEASRKNKSQVAQFVHDINRLAYFIIDGDTSDYQTNYRANIQKIKDDMQTGDKRFIFNCVQERLTEDDIVISEAKTKFEDRLIVDCGKLNID